VTRFGDDTVCGARKTKRIKKMRMTRKKGHEVRR
jgi:hypothetical protein